MRLAPSNRLFGCAIMLAIAAFEANALWREDRSYPWLLELAGIVAVVTLAQPQWLEPLRRGALALARALQQAASPLLLGLLFYGIFTPIGLVMRLAGRDAMKRSFEPQALTYWVRRNPRTVTAESFRDPF